MSPNWSNTHLTQLFDVFRICPSRGQKGITTCTRRMISPWDICQLGIFNLHGYSRWDNFATATKHILLYRGRWPEQTKTTLQTESNGKPTTRQDSMGGRGGCFYFRLRAHYLNTHQRTIFKSRHNSCPTVVWEYMQVYEGIWGYIGKYGRIPPSFSPLLSIL